MSDSNNLPKAISHKKLSSLLMNAHRDRFSSLGEDKIIESDQQEFNELLENWEENTKNIINKVSSKNETILKNKSNNSVNSCCSISYISFSSIEETISF